ncbi:GNAT family N-acetyltransferase [Rhizobium sp. TRM95796]|uniref:GNAT family N-acetyltransferase n=1 Tax=Rhizobium sp. TRM95796 TaxID=2979862 RepID=UPI0021E7C5F7|nr:GNAT family protein [Rhizobium sp. TRM95796]MCV3766173.1 GNAT family N-acetyltransferase [Rhizobium sp. TRM95796]
MQSPILKESQSGFPSDARPMPQELLLSPQLQSERLTLRAPETADAHAIAHLANNINVASKLSRMPHPYTVADAANFIARVASGAMGKCVYAVTRTDNRAFLGGCALEETDGGRGLEIGYWLGEPYWNRGLATEAAQTLIDHGFHTFGADYIDGRCRVMNTASRRVLQKCGFQFQGTGMASSLALGGRVAVEWFRLDRKTWDSLRHWGGAR